TGYVEWNEREANNCRKNLAELDGLTPEGIRCKSIDYVQARGKVTQHKETRENHADFPFYYKIALPVTGFPRGIFVEFRLTDKDDPNNPTVEIVSAHR